MLAPEPVLVPPQTFRLPAPPNGDVAAARQLARALRSTADQVEASQRRAHRVLDDARRQWTGRSATAVAHPLQLLDTRTRDVTRSLRNSAEAMERYAAHLARAHEQHRWSLAKVSRIAAVVVVTTGIVVVTIGAAAPAAAAADAAVVGAELGATAGAVAAATAAGVEAAESLALAVRALQALRAVATFVRPQVVHSAVLTDALAYRQVRDTGTLQVRSLVGQGGRDLLVGSVGGRLDDALGGLGREAANPVLRWLVPTAAKAGGQAGVSVTDQLVFDQQVSGLEITDAVGASLRDSALDALPDGLEDDG